MTSAVMIQGTGSNVGKSLIVAGLARAFTNRGLSVRPFKSQNMSNNAAVTAEGGEIGRAQALQARASKVRPTVDMNPVLLKPETNTGAQIILRGKRQTSMEAREYLEFRKELLEQALQSYMKLSKQADLILVEGAGSPAEINLREGDIANMGFAQAAGLPVILVGDIHRGGVIASIIGTLEVLKSKDRNLVKGFLINNFHGDQSIFNDGLAYIKNRTKLTCFGIIP
ncbi:MAG: cobyric acid synthase, partial [Desulfobulbia bacterium]